MRQLFLTFEQSLCPFDRVPYFFQLRRVLRFQKRSSTSISSAKKQVKKEIQRLKTDPKYMTEFFNWCFNYVSNYKDAFKIVPPTDYSMRIDDADGVAYNRTAFDFYEAEAEAKWKSS